MPYNSSNDKTPNCPLRPNRGGCNARNQRELFVGCELVAKLWQQSHGRVQISCWCHCLGHLK